MNARKTEFVVGTFAIIIFALLTFMTFKVGEFTIGKKPGYIVYANFRNSAGLYEQTKIKIAGVDAGTLEDISLVNGAAKLSLRIDPGVVLYSDASAGIRTTGLLGDRYLEIKIGSIPPVLKNGDTIENIHEFVDLDDMFKNLDTLSKNITEVVSTLNQPETRDALRESVVNIKEITASLRTVVTGNEDRINRIIAKVDSLTTSLDELVAANRTPLSNTISNFEKFSSSLGSDGPRLIANLDETVAELRSLIKDNKDDINKLVQKTSSTMDSINNVAGKVDRGEGTIGKLVNDDRLYTAITNAVGGLSNTLSAIDRFRTFVTFRGDYLERLGEGKGGFYLTLQPREDKYYILGVVGDPIGKVDRTEIFTNGTKTVEERVEKDLEFTAQFAKRFNNTAVRIGLIESSLGVGADQFLLNDKLRLYVDAWDFDTDEYLADKAHVNVGADYFVFKNIFVSGGVDNVLNSNRTGVFFGGGVKFEDEDFKYLFGSSLPNVGK